MPAIACRSYPVLVDAAAQEKVQPNFKRKFIKLAHVSGGEVLLGWDEDPNATTGDRLGALQTLVLDGEHVPSNGVRMKTRSGAAVVHVLEG